MYIFLAIYATIFQNKTMFTYCNFYQGIGFLLGFLISNFYCVDIKIEILLALTAVSAICHIILEYRCRTWRKINIKFREESNAEQMSQIKINKY